MLENNHTVFQENSSVMSSLLKNWRLCSALEPNARLLSNGAVRPNS